jgi:hypothetical protein
MIWFLDVEASSLSDDSYPIEIGWVDESGQGESYLIRPELSWTDWSADAERVHGISRDQLLSEGRPAAWVAERAAQVLARDSVRAVSDAPVIDGRWLARLLALAERRPIPLIHFHDICREGLQPILDAVGSRWSLWRALSADTLRREAEDIYDGVRAAEAMRPGRRHRALRDAEALWWRWREIRERVAARTKGGR